MEKFTFIVSEEESGIQLKKLIRAKYHFSSRLMTKIKYQDLLMLNGEKVPGYTLASAGDIVTVSIPDEISHFPPEDIPLEIIYEDDDLLVINKQPGLTCHPTKGHPDGTIANGIMKYMLDNNQSYKIRFINRLDMDTSGILLIGKNSFIQAELIKEMQSSITEKEYFAISSGKLSIDAIRNIPGITVLDDVGKESIGRFLIDLPIGNPDEGSKKRRVLPFDSNEGFPSKTEVEISGYGNDYTLLRIKLLTGRTHQIRVHLAHIGFPLLGDPLYGNESSLINRQALHAVKFSCYHPITGEWIEFNSSLPEDLLALVPS